MVRVITLPNGRQCRLGTYVKAWATLKSAALGEQVAGFSFAPMSADAIVGEMRRGLDDRINRNDRSFGVGRKWEPDYQARLCRDSRRLNDMSQRIRVYQFETDEARSRFSDRLARYDD